MIGRTNAGLAPLKPKYSIKEWCQTIGLSYESLEDIPEADMRLLMSKHASVDYFMEWYNADNSMLDAFTVNESAMKWIGQNDYICGKLMYFGQNRDATNEENANIVGFTVPSDFSVQNYVTHGQFIQKSKRVLATSITWTKAAGYDHSFYAPISELTMNDGNGSQRVYLQGYDYVIANVPNQGDKTIQSYWAYWSAIPRVFIKDNSITTVEQLTSALSGKYIYYELSTPIIHNFGHSEAGDKLLASKYWPYILKDHVPIMTSNTAPYGEAFSQGTRSGYEAYKCFSGGLSFGNSSNTSSGSYIGYSFTNPICVKKIKLRTTTSDTIQVILQGTNDKSGVWNDLTEFSISGADGEKEVLVNNDTYYIHHRIYQKSSTATNAFPMSLLQFYGRSLNVSESSAPTDGRPYKLIGSVYYTVDYSDRTEREYIYDHGIELMPIEIVKTNAVVEKRNGELYLEYSGGNIAEGFVVRNVDTTRFSIMRAFAGDKKVNNNFLCVVEHATSGMGADVAYAAISEGLPFNVYLDISSCNQNYDIGVYNKSGYTITKIDTITEWWLE